MKTIQIPTTSNPFIVNINNHAYQYRAGETAEVPDEVAEAIEDALELEPKPKRYPSKLAQLAEGSLMEITEEDLSGISSICSYAFYNIKSIMIATFSDSISAIESFAFYGCSNLETIRFGANSKLDSIGTNAFDWCAKLKSIYLPETPPALASVNAFANIKTGCIFYCKTQESLDAYKAATNWSALTSPYTFMVEA